jgi:hypothetical protein
LRRRKLTALLAPTHRQDLSTRGARGVGAKPRVDAGDMEGVAALRQSPELVPIHELSQAYGAIGCAQLSVLGVVRVRRAVGELWERLEHLLLQALVG